MIRSHGPSILKKLAVALKEEKIDAIYSSDLARAADTAKEIAKFHPDVPFHLVKELRERQMGEIEGKKRADVLAAAGVASTRDVRLTEGENLGEVYARATQFLDQTLHKHANDTVVFVGHGVINIALVCAITNKGVNGMQQAEVPPNTSISIIEINEDRSHKIHVLNSVEHLA